MKTERSGRYLLKANIDYRTHSFKEQPLARGGPYPCLIRREFMEGKSLGYKSRTGRRESALCQLRKLRKLRKREIALLAEGKSAASLVILTQVKGRAAAFPGDSCLTGPR